MGNEDYRKSVVLLVDDEADLLKGYELTLKSNGIKNVISCQDSRNVLSVLESNPVDVVVLDLMMPHIPGEKLLTEIREKYPDIPTIIVTALNDVDTALKSIHQGAKDYMVKPMEPNRFVSGIKRLLELRALQMENTLLRKSILSDSLVNPEAFSEIITKNKSMLSIFKYIEAVAITEEPILVIGETGVGKELIAKAIHELSNRKGKFVSVNVGGLDDNIFSDTLFGHRKGAFTDAHQDRSGLLEEAREGTLLLDEIGDLRMASQIKLLRLLQEREYYPLGSDKLKRSDCRVVCSTNQNLESLMEEGTFRKDLYYRLRTHHIQIPPLKDRKDDIPVLVDHFLSEASESLNREKPHLDPEVLEEFSQYQFPGNIRELRSLIFDVLSITQSETIHMEDFKTFSRSGLNKIPGTIEAEANDSTHIDFSTFSQMPTLKEMEYQAVREAMKRSSGNMSQAAKLLGINRQTMSQKLKRMDAES